MERLALGRREAAMILSISLRSFDKLLSQNAIATVRVGRRRLIPLKSLEKFLRKASK